MNDIRDILKLLEDMELTESARGLLYRDKGDVFFKGSDRKNPDEEITFNTVTYFPGIPGAYEESEEMEEAIEGVGGEYPNIIWVNTPTKASKAFAVITFDVTGTTDKMYFGRYFTDIKGDMAGKWNNKIDGSWTLNKTTSLKGSYYNLKPADLYPPNSTFDSPSELYTALAADPNNNPAVPRILEGMKELLGGELPTFENIGQMITAIRDDLGESIGPVALVQGMITSDGAEAARKDILGDDGSYAGAQINFPAAKNNGLVDSYLYIGKDVEIGISSKGEKGASASVKNIADGIKAAREKGLDDLLDQYASQVTIIEDIGSISSIEFPLKYGLEQDIIDEDTAYAIKDLIRSGAVDTDHPGVLTLQSDINAKLDNPRYNAGYHALSALAKRVSANINADSEFGEACLKFLNTSPIIQLHLNGTSGDDNYKVTGFTSKYPPDFKGTVGLDATKVYSATGTNGRVSFSYSGSKEGVKDPATNKRELRTTAKKLATGGNKDVTDILKKQQTTTSTGVGREKR
jgi:hypothetical protein